MEAKGQVLERLSWMFLLPDVLPTVDRRSPATDREIVLGAPNRAFGTYLNLCIDQNFPRKLLKGVRVLPPAFLEDILGARGWRF